MHAIKILNLSPPFFLYVFRFYIKNRLPHPNSGATPFIEVEPNLIAIKEFEEKKIPFIIKRPLPNGGCEYWKLKDLEFI